jgi:hypothetical protein
LKDIVAGAKYKILQDLGEMFDKLMLQGSIGQQFVDTGGAFPVQL